MRKKSERRQYFEAIGGKKMLHDISQYEKDTARYGKRYAVRKKSNKWLEPGRVLEYIPYEHGIRLRCETGWIELYWLTADSLRVRFRAGLEGGRMLPPFSYAVSKIDWPVVALDIAANADTLEIRTTAVVCTVHLKRFGLLLTTLDGRRIASVLHLEVTADGGNRAVFGLDPQESCYGLGERAYTLNLRGKSLTLWNNDPIDPYERGTDPLCLSIPFYLGVINSLAYGMFWDNPGHGTVDLGAARPNEIIYESEGGELRFTLFAAADPKAVIARFTELTGRIPLPPLWALGYHQARFGYDSQSRLIEIANGMRQRGIPCDVLYLDADYMQEFRVFTVDGTRFPNFETLMQKLHDAGFRLILVLNPGVKADNYNIDQSGIREGIFLKYPDGQLVTAPVWPGAAHFPDFTNPAGRAWWSEQLSALTSLGIDGIWNDMNEPKTFSIEMEVPSLPDSVQVHQDGLGGSHADYHNVYGLLMARATMEGLEKHRYNQRPFNLSRAGYAGVQRYAGAWTGDNTSTWDHLRLSLSMVLNLSMSGMSMVGPDLGGYHGNATGELLTRWMQAACFFPLFRVHASRESSAQEPWAFGQPYEVINRLVIELRYRLLPYLYSMIALCREYGLPVIRPLMMAEPDNLALRGIDDCYMVGDHMLIAPVLDQGVTSREVYLPTGEWYDYWTRERYDGGHRVRVPAPLERLPLFVRAGTVLPLWPEMQHTGEKEIDTLTLRVYAGSSETTLYEDNGIDLSYLAGNYRWVYLTCVWNINELQISRRTAGIYQPSYKTIRLEIIGLEEEPEIVRVDRQGAPLWYFDDDVLELTIDTFNRIEIKGKPLPSDLTVSHRPW